MSQRLAVAARKRRRMITYGWVAGLAIVTILLIYKEQTALLYILATLSVTALLIVVATADLRGSRVTESPTLDNSPAVVAESSTSSRSTTVRRR